MSFSSEVQDHSQFSSKVNQYLVLRHSNTCSLLTTNYSCTCQVGGDDETTRPTATARQGLAEGEADPAGYAGRPPAAVPVTAQDPP